MKDERSFCLLSQYCWSSSELIFDPPVLFQENKIDIIWGHFLVGNLHLQIKWELKSFIASEIRYTSD